MTSAVTFATPAGTLQLDQSQTFKGTVKGMSTTVGTTLDLSDIGFGGATTATYSGTTTSGVLTVTDGTHTATITLLGNYTNSTFSVAADGHGGTNVTDPPKAGKVASPAPTHAFIAAMASFDAGARARALWRTSWDVRSCLSWSRQAPTRPRRGSSILQKRRPALRLVAKVGRATGGTGRRTGLRFRPDCENIP